MSAQPGPSRPPGSQTLKRNFSDYLAGQDKVGLDAYPVCRRRFTLRGREVNGLPILPPIQDQTGLGGKCAFFACTTGLGAQLRVRGINKILCYKDLFEKVRVSGQENPNLQNLPKTERCFRVMRDEGVQVEDGTEIYRITGFKKFHPQHHGDINEALKSYLRKGPMVGVTRIDRPIFKEYGKKKVGVYSWSTNSCLTKDQLRDLPTHTVTVIGFGVDTNTPFFEVQNSYGDKWHFHGFGEFYALDFVELYGFDDVYRQA